MDTLTKNNTVPGTADEWSAIQHPRAQACLPLNLPKRPGDHVKGHQQCPKVVHLHRQARVGIPCRRIFLTHPVSYLDPPKFMQRPSSNSPPGPLQRSINLIWSRKATRTVFALG